MGHAVHIFLQSCTSSSHAHQSLDWYSVPFLCSFHEALYRDVLSASPQESSSVQVEGECRGKQVPLEMD